MATYTKPSEYLAPPIEEFANANNPPSGVVFQGPANPKFGFASQTSPQEIPAEVIGTEPVNLPALNTETRQQQISSIESQAANIQELLNQRVAAENAAAGTEGTGTGGTGTGGTGTEGIGTEGTGTGTSTSVTGTVAPGTGTGTETGIGDLGDQALAAYMENALGGFQLSEESEGLRTKAAEKKLVLENLSAEITDYNKQSKDDLYRMSKNLEGKSMGANAASMNNYRYERYARKDGAADMAIEAQFALNEAEFAYEIANNAVSAEKDAYTSQLQAFKDIYTMSRNDMSQSEQLQFQSQLRMYETQVTSLSEAKEAAMQRASSAGAPEEVILGIKNSTTPAEVWANAGKYGEDPSLTLARDKFYWDVQYAKQKLALDAAVNQGLINQNQYNLMQETNAKRAEMGKAIQAIERIQGNAIGIGATTGKVTGRTAGFFDLGLRTGGVMGAGGLMSGGPVLGMAAAGGGFLVGGLAGASEAREQQEEIANDMNYIEAQLTTQAIGKAKALGLTGTMSDNDIKLLGDSADVLTSAWNPETMTFSGDPKSINTHINTLKTTLDTNRNQLLFSPDYQEAILGDDASAIDNQF